MIKKRVRNQIMKNICNKFYKENREMISLYELCGITNKKHEEIYKIVVVLCSMGYLNYHEKNAPSVQDFVSLTDQGKCYFETKNDVYYEFLRKSVITPIIISLLTALVVELIKYLLL